MPGSNQPQWWERNRRLRDRFDLPAYEPPVFSDGTYVHTVIDEFETRFDCSITLQNTAPEVSDTWTVYVDGDPALEFERARTTDGNAVYRIDTAEFKSAVTSIAVEDA